ncbi:hypothetical protein RI543_000210 [Arxiozyma heterogenica]|uniref:Transcriptional regulatory protein RXT2 N-terminal domain-containing protein n=1 Tax=Arxiozyma heterogenica TaxID=278026 RepID=A0AAN8A9Y2_9SACH|nr:hypothetical protein RI543_000210 [Kazachstania heterogenica]
MLLWFKNLKKDEGNDSNEEFNEQLFIKAFSQRIIRDRTGNFPHYKRPLNENLNKDSTRTTSNIFDSVDSKIFTNRGNKLLQNSEYVTKRKLFNPMALNEDVIYYNGSEHKLLHRKKVKFSNNEIQNDNNILEDDMNDQDIDLHKLVNVRDILTPISSLSDIVNKPSTLRIFQNKIMYDLSLKIVLMIEREQSFVNRYSNLLDIFLGDYPNPLYESILKLKDYDHNLILPDKEDDEEENKEMVEEMGTKNKNIEKQKDINGNERNNTDNTVEDPFFALPEISNKDGLKLLIGDNNDISDLNKISNINDQFELTRQMTQIALQRNEEFIRNLLKIRNFLDKSNRIRERILSWSKESVGIQDDDVTVPSVLRVVKRGLISATTNQTVRETDENVDENTNNDKENKEIKRDRAE